MQVEGVTERDERPWWVRARSGVLLALLLTGLGVLVAAVIGVSVLAIAALLDQALG